MLNLLYLINAFFILYFVIYRKPRPEDQIQYLIADKKDRRVVKAHVNAIFFKQLRALLGMYNNYL